MTVKKLTAIVFPRKVMPRWARWPIRFFEGAAIGLNLYIFWFRPEPFIIGNQSGWPNLAVAVILASLMLVPWNEAKPAEPDPLACAGMLGVREFPRPCQEAPVWRIEATGDIFCNMHLDVVLKDYADRGEGIRFTRIDSAEG